MAGRRTTELTETVSLSNEDLVYVVDQSAATNSKSKKIRVDSLKSTLGVGTSTGASRVISGGMQYVSGLTWQSIDLVYEIGGETFEITDGTQVTLDAADATDPRIDLIYGDDTGALDKSTGTPAATPSANTLPGYQLQLVIATVAATATTPTGVSIRTVYTENAGQSGEFDATESTSAARIVVNNGTSPITGSFDIKTTATISNGDYIQFDHATPTTFANLSSIDLDLKLLADWGNDYLEIRLQDGAAIKANANINSSVIDVTNTTSVQTATVFKNDFNIASGSVDFNRIILFNRVRASSTILYQLDNIYIYEDSGATQPTNITASDVPTDTTNFDNNLSDADDTVQKALDTLDDLTLGGLNNVVEDTTPQLGGDLDLNGNAIDFPTTSGITDVLDEDNMASDSATALATQQSIKAYVDANVGVAALEYQTAITAASTVLSSAHIGSKLNRFESATAQTATLNDGVFSLDDEIYFTRTGEGSFELVKGTNVRLTGVRNINNAFFINNKNSWIVAKYMEDDGSTEVWEVIGRLTDGYTGAVTTSSYAGLAPSETKDVAVAGTGFSSNMEDPVITGNASLNSWVYNSPTSITLNITSSGGEGDKLTITYDNGDVFVDTDAITMTTASLANITFTTTSTSATYSPNTITNSGSTLHWEVTGDVTPSSYDANSPTMNLSSNTGTATIIVTSADDLAGLTAFTMSSKNLTSIDPTGATALTSLIVSSNQITGTIDTTGLTSLSIFHPFINAGLTSLDVTTNTALTQLFALNCGLTSAPDLSNNTSLTSLRIGSNPSMGNIDLTSNTALVTIELYQCGLTGALDFTANTACTSLLLYTNASATSVDVTGLTVLATLNGHTSGYTHVTGLGDSGALLGSVTFQSCALSQSGVNNMIIDTDNGKTSGTRTLNYTVGSGTNATPTATESTTDDVLDAYNSLVADGWTVTGATPS